MMKLLHAIQTHADLIRKPMPSALKASRSRIRNYGSSLTARLPRFKSAFPEKRNLLSLCTAIWSRT